MSISLFEIKWNFLNIVFNEMTEDIREENLQGIFEH